MSNSRFRQWIARSGEAPVIVILLAIFVLLASRSEATRDNSPMWISIDDFEAPDTLESWHLRDTRNDTEPFIEKPQVTEIRVEENGNRYLLKKPAAEGVVGNRKALSFRKLPQSIPLGETWTIYTRFRIETFPNNHIFGLSNLDADGIAEHDYNALEPAIRVTDKLESNGFKNDGTLQVRADGGYRYIQNPVTGTRAMPLEPGVWYEIWYVVNNATIANGGQTYDLFIRGGEFPSQQNVFSGATFRMKREMPLTWFMTNCNTGPADKPYGNGGLMYDDLNMAKGKQLSSPRT